MRKMTDFIFIGKYCIPIDEIKYIQENEDRELYIYLDKNPIPLVVENCDLDVLLKAFKLIQVEGEK